jgi:opacity protein-like surface antigen
MNSKLFLMTAAVIAAFGITVAAAAVVGPLAITTPAIAQNMTGGNATMMAGNMTAGSTTGGNWTK